MNLNGPDRMRGHQGHQREVTFTKRLLCLGPLYAQEAVDGLSSATQRGPHHPGQFISAGVLVKERGAPERGRTDDLVAGDNGANTKQRIASSRPWIKLMIVLVVGAHAVRVTS